MGRPFAEIHPLLRIDAEQVAAGLVRSIAEQVRFDLAREGAIVAVSGGVDSTVVAALCVRALGADGVVAVLMPERDSSASTCELSRLVADHLGVRAHEEDITPILEAVGCYRRRDEAVRKVMPDYTSEYSCKVVTESVLECDDVPGYAIVIASPDGTQQRKDLPIDALRAVVAATNFKQRTRKMLEYYYADRYHFAVAGTPNRLEYDLGFFVKNGDGAADLKPIAHLYKSHVYQLAEYLEVPEAVTAQMPSTDTYSLEQTQEEFFFALPLELLDLCLLCKNSGKSFGEAAEITGLSEDQVAAVFADIVAKRSMAAYLHAGPLLGN